MLKKTLWIALIALVVFAPTVADAGEWKLRGRVISVSPDSDSDLIPGTAIVPETPTRAFEDGTIVDVDSATTLEVDVTYMFNEKWGLEVIAAMPSHDLTGKGGTLNGADLGTADLIPPCFTAQYFFATKGALKPYIGAGFNYTFFSYDRSDDVEGLGLDIELDDAAAFVLDAGLDFNLKNNWSLNFDVKYVPLSTDATIKDASTGAEVATVGVDINPWIIGLGVGYKF